MMPYNADLMNWQGEDQQQAYISVVVMYDSRILSYYDMGWPEIISEVKASVLMKPLEDRITSSFAKHVFSWNSTVFSFPQSLSIW